MYCKTISETPDYQFDQCSIYTYDSYEKALNRVLAGDEFAEFPFSETLMNLKNASSKFQYCHDKVFQDDFVNLEVNGNTRIDNANYLLSSCYNKNKLALESTLAFVDKLEQEMLQNFHFTNYKIKLSLATNQAHHINWHSDHCSVCNEKDSLVIFMPLNGPGTVYCDLFEADREINYNIVSSYDPRNFTQNLELDDAQAKFLNAACSKEKQNIFQVSDNNGFIFAQREGVPAIHSAPNYSNERITIRFDIYNI